MTTIEEIKVASYRGIPFFYDGSTETGGFKVAEHLYPGSNNFIVEQLGRNPQKFDIQCKVKTENKQNFDVALNTPGNGTLNHPMLGTFLVKVTSYNKSDAIDALGYYNYQVQFVVEIGLIVPTVEQLSIAVISQLRANLLDKASAGLKTSLKRLGL